MTSEQYHDIGTAAGLVGEVLFLFVFHSEIEELDHQTATELADRFAVGIGVASVCKAYGING